MRITERPRTNSSPSPRTSPRVAALVPAKTGAMAASTQRSASSTTTGVPGATIPAAAGAHSRSQPTSTRRAGYRSATADSSVPPTTYGSSPSAKVRALSNGEAVSRKTRTDSAISQTTTPSDDSRCAAKTQRNSGTAKTAR